jgi:hypothetical protein
LSAKNDVKALRDFLLKSYCKFKRENITVLIDPTHEEIVAAMEAFKKKIENREGTKPTNIFYAYSGHGTSIKGRLNITLPSSVTEEEYASIKEEIAEVTWKEELLDILSDFKEAEA